MIDLNKKKVLLTGASGGIGKAIAKELNSCWCPHMFNRKK